MLGSGSIGYALAGQPTIGLSLAALVVVHYVASQARLSWLIAQ